MEDFLNTLVYLAAIDQTPIHLTFAVMAVGVLGFAAPAMINLFYSFKSDEPDVSGEEQRLSQQFSILFQIKMELEKRSESVDFEKTKLVEIGNRLDEIRAIKACR